MPPDDLARRITAQFSERGERGDVWKTLGLFLDTDRFLNLGYSPAYLPSVVGSPQLRLADKMGNELVSLLDGAPKRRLLDVGCGRGGPSAHFVEKYGFVVTGIDLVPKNARLAAMNTATIGRDKFAIAIADGLHLPFRPGSFDACVAVDSAPYLSDRERWLREVGRVVADGGLLAYSDLVLPSPPGDEPRTAEIESFLDAWDMAPLATVESQRDDLGGTGWEVIDVEDVTRGSIGRLSKWTRLYLTMAGTPVDGVLRRILGHYGLDLDPMADRIRRTHPVLPHLRHVIFVCRRTV